MRLQIIAPLVVCLHYCFYSFDLTRAWSSSYEKHQSRTVSCRRRRRQGIYYVPLFSARNDSRTARYFSSSDDGGGSSTTDDLNSSNDNDSSSFNLSELSRRIATVRTTEENWDKRYLKLPVICFDALLPGQVLEGQTTDDLFCHVLTHTIGLGGQFVMISLNYKQRKLRRHGVVCRVEYMDANYELENPTAVDFQIRGIRCCRVVGPTSDMYQRVGRWRRMYDYENGEESVLGWGEEKFVDHILASDMIDDNNEDNNEDSGSSVSSLPDFRQPSSCWVDCQLSDDGESSTSRQEESELINERIIPLLETWENLASDPKTYDNTDVVATARIRKGQPGLRVDCQALINQVKRNLGDRPDQHADDGPAALAVWGAALVNPLPVLGVSPEIRGRVLEAPTALEKLQILEWGAQKSIRNLQGTDPL